VVAKTRQRLETAQSDITRIEQRLAALPRGEDPPQTPPHGGAARPPVPPRAPR
jgi:hypothetical protein